MKSSTVIMLNTLGWPVLQLSLALVFTKLPDHLFTQEACLAPVHPGEAKFYRSRLRIRDWKHVLPDGAQWIGGGFSKQRVRSRHPAYLRRFLLETRRSELAHWSMVACLPIFYLWNPPWARTTMTLYALGVNLPCIVTQRYNRATIERILTHQRAFAL
jgi:glycosyl-4,4'-diaponeurosporenoate acyltransferase